MQIARLAAFALVTLVAARDLRGQIDVPVRVPDSPSCGECLITVQEIASLGTTEGAGSLPGIPSSVTLDGLGRYWVLGGRLPMVFSASGAFIQAVGSSGQGPAEYVQPMGALALPGDSVLVLDARGLRATVVSADLRAGRMVKLMDPLSPVGVVVRWPDTVVVGGLFYTPEAAGWPVHLASFTQDRAVFLRHFGPDKGELRPSGPPSSNLQHLTPSNRGLAWTSDRKAYRLTLWNANGTKARTLTRQPKWFEGPSEFALGTPTTPPPAGIAAIREDSAGLIWVFANVPAKTWREAWPARGGGGAEVSVGSIAFEKLFNTMVEVIDPQTGRLIASRPMDGLVISAMPGGRVATYSVDANGVPRVKVVVAQVTRP